MLSSLCCMEMVAIIDTLTAVSRSTKRWKHVPIFSVETQNRNRPSKADAWSPRCHHRRRRRFPWVWGEGRSENLPISRRRGTSLAFSIHRDELSIGHPILSLSLSHWSDWIYFVRPQIRMAWNCGFDFHSTINNSTLTTIRRSKSTNRTFFVIQ